jgi:hypothetical protein
MVIEKNLVEAFSLVPSMKSIMAYQPVLKTPTAILYREMRVLAGFSQSPAWPCQCGYTHPGAGECLLLAFPDPKAMHCSCGCTVPK